MSFGLSYHWEVNPKLTLIIIAVLEIVVIHSIAHYIGTKRKIGYGKSVFWSIVLTPVFGLIITLSSKKI